MIARINFTGITKKDNKRSTLEDHVDLHTNDLKEAREIFSAWTKAGGIRGASGVFHPLNGYGDIRIKNITETTKASSGLLEEVEEEDQEHEKAEEAAPAKNQKAKT